MRRAPAGAASASNHSTSRERLKADRLVMGDGRARPPLRMPGLSLGPDSGPTLARVNQTSQEDGCDG